MKKLFGVIIVGLLASVLSGCGWVNTGEVGVRTQFGEVEKETVPVGFYTSWLSDVKIYSVKEVYVNLKDMQPKAKDNLSLTDFEVTVYYSINGAKAPEYQSKYAGSNTKLDDGVYILGYDRVEKAAGNAVNDAVSRFDSLTIHTQREEVQHIIKQLVQQQLDEASPDVFHITRVVVNNVKTDPKVEATIIKNIEADKRLEIARKETTIQKEIAKANEELTSSLTPAYLQHEFNQAVLECAKAPNCTLIIDGTGTTTKNIPVSR